MFLHHGLIIQLTLNENSLCFGTQSQLLDVYKKQPAAEKHVTTTGSLSMSNLQYKGVKGLTGVGV